MFGLTWGQQGQESISMSAHTVLAEDLPIPLFKVTPTGEGQV